MLLDKNGHEARPGCRSRCPGCDGEVIAKCGRIITWHWAHLASDCDPWSEPESQWHINWKHELRSVGAAIEVVIGEHRADAVLPDRTVVELQSSYLSAAEIEERERFYGERLIWVYRAHWADRIHYGARGFWWKHGAKSLATHRRPLLWHFPNDEMVVVSLGVVKGEYASRVLGRTKFKTNKSDFLRLLMERHGSPGEANAPHG